MRPIPLWKESGSRRVMRAGSIHRGIHEVLQQQMFGCRAYGMTSVVFFASVRIRHVKNAASSRRNAREYNFFLSPEPHSVHQNNARRVGIGGKLSAFFLIPNSFIRWRYLHEWYASATTCPIAKKKSFFPDDETCSRNKSTTLLMSFFLISIFLLFPSVSCEGRSIYMGSRKRWCSRKLHGASVKSLRPAHLSPYSRQKHEGRRAAAIRSAG